MIKPAAYIGSVFCLMLLNGLALSAETPLPPANKLEVEDIALSRPVPNEEEQSINMMVRAEVPQVQDQVGRLAGRKLLELNLRRTVFTALRKNLNIRRSEVATHIAQAALQEAEAVFNPILLLSFNYNHTEIYDRTETALKFRPATQRRTLTDGTTRDVLVTTSPDPNIPNTTVVLNGPRAEQFSPSTVVASQAPPNGPTVSKNYRVQLFQQLPWGANLQLGYQALDQDTFFFNNQAGRNVNRALDLSSFGSYNRPWVSTLITNLVFPLPGSRDFGPFAEQHVAIRFAELERERAYWVVEDIINTTLLQVELAYWDLINRLQSLQVLIANRNSVEKLLRVTQRIYDIREATNYDRYQVEAEFARVQGDVERGWNDYLVASNALVQLLDLEPTAVILPTEYGFLLQQPFPLVGISMDHVNPAVTSAEVDINSAQLEQKRREVRTRPNLNVVARAQFSQSRQRFGYKTLGSSLANVTDPDTIIRQYSLIYTYPIGNRLVKSQYAQASASLDQQQATRQQVQNRVQRELNDARITLENANRRIAITAAAVRLAERTYAKAQLQQEQRSITEYEVVAQNRRLWSAKLAHILAQTQRKQAEAQLLAALGVLPSVYPQRLAQTDLDRHRLGLLSVNRVLHHFGGPTP